MHLDCGHADRDSGWVPTKTMAREFVSLFLRLGLAYFLGALLMVGIGLAQTNVFPGDTWLTNEFQYPNSRGGRVVTNGEFGGLHAEAQAGRLKIIWPTPMVRGSVSAVVSIDDPGHWPARDWFSIPLIHHADGWEGRVPLESLDTPVIYFVRTTVGTAPHVSPPRLCDPREAGLEQPDHFFWSFLEGFEEGTERWRVLGEGRAELRTDPFARSGRAALVISLPAGRHSATVGTTRLRGANIVENGMTGVRLWLRTRSGEGRAQFTLWADAFSAKQSQAVFEEEPVISDRWTKIELPFSRFSRISRSGIDFFSIEVIGDGPCDFLMDDVELMGRGY